MQTLWWLQTEIEAIRDDIAPTWLQHPLSLQQTADKFVRPSLQQVDHVNQHQTVSVAIYAHAFTAHMGYHTTHDQTAHCKDCSLGQCLPRYLLAGM